MTTRRGSTCLLVDRSSASVTVSQRRDDKNLARLKVTDRGTCPDQQNTIRPLSEPPWQLVPAPGAGVVSLPCTGSTPELVGLR